MPKNTRFALVGTGNRSFMFRRALLESNGEYGQLCAVCDSNPLRMNAWHADIARKVPTYAPQDFESMLKENRIDSVIVTCPDFLHHEYICRAMYAGCDTITEKPLTIDLDRAASIIKAQRETGRNLRVAFNYRYAPRHSKIKELLNRGLIGKVLSVNFEWLLDTNHGADYFRRWHRDKSKSGGLLVHKSTHHFDLVNWWIASLPQEVFAWGALRFYGPTNAVSRGESRSYLRSTGSKEAKADPFALDLNSQPFLKRLYLDCEDADNYRRDLNVFGDGITIEDDAGVLVRYCNGAVMTYHLNAYSPGEGYRVAFNGTKGRLELAVTETWFAKPGQEDHPSHTNEEGFQKLDEPEPTSILLRPHWGPVYRIPIPEISGGHGGGDEVMLKELFTAPEADPLGRAASLEDGLRSIYTGIAANESIRTGLPVVLKDHLAKHNIGV